MAANTVVVVVIITSIIFSIIVFFGIAKSKKNHGSSYIHGGLTLAGETCIGEDINQYILYDPESGVMYAFCVRCGTAGGMTVLYNADETLKKYSPRKEELN